MKKAVKLAVVLLVVVLAISGLVACASGENAVVGKWKFSTLDYSYGNDTQDANLDMLVTWAIFKDDGTGTLGGDSFVWKYDKSAKEYLLAQKEEDFGTNNVERAMIDKDGKLHIDAAVFVKKD